MWKRKRKRDAFTLIELVVVIVILGILAAVAIPKYMDISDKAEEAACEAKRGVIRSACSMYYASKAVNGQTPAFPSTYNDTSLYADETVPTCPTGGTYTYDSTKNTVTCDEHP